jgi:hypothetical protein
LTANAKGLNRIVFLGAAMIFAHLPGQAEDLYGPPNYFHTIKTPFGAADSAKSAQATSQDPDGMAPIGLTSGSSGRQSLLRRLSQSRLYLPEKMQLGRTAEFTIKGKSGNWVAIAMADKNTGAKPIANHAIRLGSDRKVVAIGQIPESGILVLNIETPIEGDLIGLSLYFEAATWSKADMSDVEIATTIPSEGQSKDTNGVLIAAEPDQKKGIRIVPDGFMPSRGMSNAGVETNKP